MSLKPPKKSDLGKSWMKPRRDKNILIRPEYHLIVTEGTETEPQYFEAIRNIINSQYRDKIQLDIHGAGDNTLSLLDKAMNLVRSNPNGYKHVWIVYDTDDFPANRINKTNESCINLSTEETQYHAIWSNQCIELWFCIIILCVERVMLRPIPLPLCFNGSKVIFAHSCFILFLVFS